MTTINTASSKRAALPPERRPGAAFSLLELLVVVAIIAIVGSLAVSGLGVWSGRGVTNAGNLLLENISFSRELAVSLDRPVEIWFLRAQGTTPVTAFQIYTIDDNGNAAPYSEVYHIPTGAIIDSGNSSSAQNLSPLIAAATVRQWAGAQAKPSIGTFGSNYDCWYVRFMPDSSTTLAPSQQWYLTVHAQTLGDPLPSLPANYAVVSIEPFTGHVALYRP